MNKRVVLTISAALLALVMWGCSVGPAQESVLPAGAPATTTDYKFFAPDSEQELQTAALLGKVNKGYVIVKAVQGFNANVFMAMGAENLGSFDLDGYTYFRLRKIGATVKFVRDIGRLNGVAYAEHELLSELPPNEVAPPSNEGATQSKAADDIAAVLNDPETWGRFGHFETTQTLEAYKRYGYGPNTVYVASIDSGINRMHEDMVDAQGNQIVEYAKSAFSSDDQGMFFKFVGTGNPFVTIPTGQNWDDIEHGSHTIGTIAALGNNAKGVAGVCWKNVRIISYKCFARADGSGSDWAVYNGLKDLVEWKKANNITQTIPVNMSLGGSMAGQFELEMINLALANNIVIIASMGNDGVVKSQFPASYAGVIAVGATRANGEKVHFSSMGKHISVAAPGYNIYSLGTHADNDYTDMSGTSMAAPFVSGLVAYMLTYNPTLTPDQIKTVLELTADDKGTPGWDQEFGYGQVNVLKAIRMVKKGNVPPAGSVYSTKKIVVSVKNENANYDSGIVGHRNAVIGQPVFLYDAYGAYVAVGLTNGIDGSVEFRLLKPAKYKVVTNYFNTKKETTLMLGNSSDVQASMSFDVPILLIQTVPNTFFSGGASGADTMITLYDSTGSSIIAGPLDKGALDTLVVSGLQSGVTYYVSIKPYLSGGVPLRGEYGLNIGFAAKASVNVNPGRPQNVDDADGNVDAAHAKSVVLGQDYGEYLNTNGEWFKFVMP